MFLIDSLMIGGISWTLRTVLTAAEAEMNDDTALREQLLAAEMQREMGEITDQDFAEIERDLLGRIREIKERREGGSGPLAFGEGEPIESGEGGRFQIEATVSGDFHEPSETPHTTIVEHAPSRGGIVGVESGQTEQVIDVQPVRAVTVTPPGRTRRAPREAASKTRGKPVQSAGRASAALPRRGPRGAQARASGGSPRRSSRSAHARAKVGKVR